ncbi:MAG TPA: DUF3617 family protein [Kofleriaceae bacterium]|jgi:hypothetical protein
MRTIGCVLSVLLLSTAAASADTALNLQEGSWKITRLISLGSQHELTKPAPTTECLSPSTPYPAADVGWPDGTKCTSETAVAGNVVTWSFTCTKDKTTTTGKGPLTFSGKKFSGTINIETVTEDDSGMAGRRGLLKVSGAYTGVCAANAPAKK